MKLFGTIELVITSLVIVSLVEGYAFGGIDFRNIIIDSILTNPSLIHAGDYFTLNATVRNNSNDTIDILNFGCNGPMRLLFDKSIEVKAISSGICYNPKHVITLRPGESTVLSGPDTELYRGITEGIVDATVQLEYGKEIDNQIITSAIVENKSSYMRFLSEPFKFNITTLK